MQVFPFSQQSLHNITETAPETWDGGFYDEMSDVFSFAIILWRLFGSKKQNKGYQEEKRETKRAEPTDHESTKGEDDGGDEYAFLQENGKFLPPPRQREAIRKV
jgi:hypothetical protein